MIGHQMLGLINMRLKEAFSENNNKPFSSRSVIILSDFRQFSSILNLPMYAGTISRDVSSNNGLAIYKQFREVYKLDVI